jgi:hypothetical protein
VRSSIPFRRILWAFTGIVFVSLLACSKVNKENYDRLKVGMGYQEATALLGEPDACEALLALKNCTWGKEPKTITIQFAADKVILFEGKGL